jgi:recombination protein RecA
MATRTKKAHSNLQALKDMLNKKAEISYNLGENDPSTVTEWIPTGSRWLDNIIKQGTRAGIPVGKISEIAGLEATGKSYMAVQAAVNAQKMGMDVVYFDSESAIDAVFLEKSGVDLEKLLYIPATSVEFVFNTIDTVIAQTENQVLFVWDSLAFTPCDADNESEALNPNAGGMLRKPKICGSGLQRLLNPLNAGQHSLLVINQLRVNIPKTPAEALTTPYFTPGGKALLYAYTLRIWLTGRKARASFIENSLGERIGSSVMAKIEKSRGGTQGRKCNFQILWGGNKVGIQDEESWLDAIKTSDYVQGAGAWKTLEFEDGTLSKKFQGGSWLKMLEDEKFKARVLQILDQETVLKVAEENVDS